MPETTIRSYPSDHLIQILDPLGVEVAPVPADLTDEQLHDMLRLMILGRSFDQKAISLQRWAGLAWAGQWEHQTYLAVPATRGGKAGPSDSTEPVAANS